MLHTIEKALILKENTQAITFQYTPQGFKSPTVQKLRNLVYISVAKTASNENILQLKLKQQPLLECCLSFQFQSLQSSRNL